jgi:hypothetical protein
MAGSGLEMQETGMPGGFWRTVIRRHLVDEAPDAMAACLDCNVTECDQNRYASCPIRLAYLAEAERYAAAHLAAHIDPRQRDRVSLA